MTESARGRELARYCCCAVLLSRAVRVCQPVEKSTKIFLIGTETPVTKGKRQASHPTQIVRK